MGKPAPARYRTTNWSSYNASLKQRGDLLAWFASSRSKPSRPNIFSDADLSLDKAMLQGVLRRKLQGLPKSVSWWMGRVVNGMYQSVGIAKSFG